MLYICIVNLLTKIQHTNMKHSKHGFSSYTCDTDRFHDMALRRLRKSLGAVGFAVYEYLLNEVYRVNGCFLVWNDSTAFDVADYWGVGEREVAEIVRYCGKVGLFDEELLARGIISSTAIRSRYLKLCKQAKRRVAEGEIEAVLSAAVRNAEKLPEEGANIAEETEKIREEGASVPEKSSKVSENSVKVPEKRNEKKSNQKKRKEKNKKKKISTCVDTKEKSPSSSTVESEPGVAGSSQGLDAEIEKIKGEQSWVNHTCANLGIEVGEMGARLEEFRQRCLCDGKTSHYNLADAKKHFNNWLRKKLKFEKYENQQHATISERRATEPGHTERKSFRAAFSLRNRAPDGL